MRIRFERGADDMRSGRDILCGGWVAVCLSTKALVRCLLASDIIQTVAQVQAYRVSLLGLHYVALVVTCIDVSKIPPIYFIYRL